MFGGSIAFAISLGDVLMDTLFMFKSFDSLIKPVAAKAIRHTPP